MRKKDKPHALELASEIDPVDPLPGAPVPGEMDAAESRWDPWLIALAKMAAEGEARPN